MKELQEVETLETQKLEQGYMGDDENMQGLECEVCARAGRWVGS
jgi:hypothetical protein